MPVCCLLLIAYQEFILVYSIIMDIGFSSCELFKLMLCFASLFSASVRIFGICDHSFSPFPSKPFCIEQVSREHGSPPQSRMHLFLPPISLTNLFSDSQKVAGWLGKHTCRECLSEHSRPRLHGYNYCTKRVRGI